MEYDEDFGAASDTQEVQEMRYSYLKWVAGILGIGALAKLALLQYVTSLRAQALESDGKGDGGAHSAPQPRSAEIGRWLAQANQEDDESQRLAALSGARRR